jgi:hypothetical protein
MFLFVRRPCLYVSFLFACALGSPVRAQDTAIVKPEPWIFAFTFGLPGYGSDMVPEALTLGIQVTQLRPNRLSADVALGTMPRALAEGFVVMGLRGGVAVPLRLSDEAYLLPSAGISALGVANETGGGVLGVNTGLSVVLGRDGRDGVRVGMTWHKFQEVRGAVWLLEFGIIP